MFNLNALHETVKESGKSQAQLARDLEVSPNLINAYMRGNKSPKPMQLIKILLACDVDIDKQLLTDWYVVE